MLVDCPNCQKRYDDEVRWTICPHNRLEASPDGDGRGAHGMGYCEEHDLFNCPNHPYRDSDPYAGIVHAPPPGLLRRLYSALFGGAV